MNPENDDKLTFAIIGAAMRVLNTLGIGFSEKVYENALVVELRQMRFKADQQRHFPIYYKGIVVGEYIPDVLVEEDVLVDLKVVDVIGPQEITQMLNYLKVSGMRVGLILNFKNTKLEYKRIAG